MMSRLTILAALLMALFLPSVAHASDPYLEAAGPLPTAQSPAQGKWTNMRPGSFGAKGAAAAEQCNRNRLSGIVGLTAEQCAELGRMADAGEGRVVGVSDGVTFNIMNGRRDGRSFTTTLVEKQLGRIDRAELFYAGEDQYGNKYYAYFFRGEKTSCNNIGWVILPPLPPPPLQVRQMKKELKPNCRLVRVDSQPMPPTQRQFLPGFLLQSCCPTCAGPTFIPPMLLQQPSGSSTSWIRVCEPEGE